MPIAILKGNWITAIRTAAVSAVCAKYLAPCRGLLQQAPTIGIFGLGLQAYVHVLAFKSIFKNPKFVLYNHDEKELAKFLKKLPKEKFTILKNFHEVVKKSDIILSATTFPPKITPYIFKSDLKNDVLILPLEYGTRIEPGLYKHLDEIYTDDIPQYELKSKLRHYFPSTSPKIKKEIGELVSKKYKRKNVPKRILVFNLGIALFDILTAELFLKKFKG
jgi:ornithine cyclodeaminase/alanine dehydrogenase